jgi:hypothetical protein
MVKAGGEVGARARKGGGFSASTDAARPMIHEALDFRAQTRDQGMEPVIDPMERTISERLKRGAMIEPRGRGDRAQTPGHGCHDRWTDGIASLAGWESSLDERSIRCTRAAEARDTERRLTRRLQIVARQQNQPPTERS